MAWGTPLWESMNNSRPNLVGTRDIQSWNFITVILMIFWRGCRLTYAFYFSRRRSRVLSLAGIPPFIPAGQNCAELSRPWSPYRTFLNSGPTERTSASAFLYFINRINYFLLAPILSYMSQPPIFPISSYYCFIAFTPVAPHAYHNSWWVSR